MRTLDPSIRQAAQRVTAWYVARWQAQMEAMDSQTPDPADTGPDLAPVHDPRGPQQTPPVHEPGRAPGRTPPKKAGLAS